MKKYFGSLSNKLEDWHKGNQKSLKAFGVTPNQWAFLLLSLLQGSKDSFAADNQILVCPTPEIADDLYELFKGRLESHSVLSYPGLENSPYGGIVSSERNLMQRFRVLYQLTQEQASPNLILTTKEALLHKCPPATFFESGHLKIEISDVVSPEELAGKLFDLGYQSAPSVEEPGTFSHKGEIFDIFPTNSFPVRLHYFDDMIEAIFKIDPNSQKSLKNQTLESLVVAISPACLARSEYSTVLRNHIPKPGPSFKAKFENRKHIFELLSSRILFENYAAFAPLFFDRPATLCEYLDSNNTVLTFLEADSGSQNTIEYFEEIRAEHEENIESLDSESILPKPSFLYQLESGELYEKFKTLKLNHLEMTSQFDEGFDDRLVFNLENSKIYLNRSANPALKKAEYLKSLFEALKIEFKYDGQLVFSLSHENSRAEIEHLMELFEYPSSLKERTEFIRFPLSEGFYYPNEKTLVLTDSDLFSLKKKKTKTNFHQNVDLFAEQLATLKVGDFVVHNDFGIGEYLGLETMEVGGSSSDFLIIEYASNDKIYLPVYKMNLIQKHADSAASVKPDNLRTNKFKNLKDRAKDSVKKLAFDLLKLQAERESAQAFAFSPPDHYFKEFELDFPFQETVDQLGAIDRVLHDMQKLRPMDHLVCGDVGFG
ncbi:MAG: hypothetical protein HOM21_11750, partial [Halobacteriovoraceae bacterium]|nr:hypothetical protein [Halobacteriovoraceae bacterium]